MSLLTSLTSALAGASPPPAPSPRLNSADVQRQLEAAERALALSRARYAPLAYRVHRDQDGSAAAELTKVDAHDLAQLDIEIVAAGTKVRRLTAVLSETKKAEELARAIAAENIFELQRRSVAAHTGLMKAAAEELSKADKARAAAFKKLITASEKARASCPIGFNWPSWPTVSALTLDAEYEAFRHSEGGMTNGAPSPLNPPGAKAPPGLINSPSKVTPITETVAGYVEYLNAALKRHSDGFKT